MNRELTQPIFSFTSFFDYLNYWISYQKSAKGLSLGQLVIKLDLNSVSELQHFAKGRRKVSARFLEKFIAVLDLSAQEEFYLRLIAEADRNSENQILSSVLNEKITLIKQETLNAI